ncbi:MAG: tetratricopeptide repeat protein, partial [Actinomycetota bacterium]|nr:tetratricopeptide repeat protein [Actinomycetota bacterium]
MRDGESLLLGPPETVSVDVDAFELAAARAWRVRDLQAVETALEHYAGDLLPDDPFDDWAEPRRVGLRTTCLALLARLARLAEQRGDLDRAIAALQRILALEPAQEETHVALMRVFALAGRRPQALAQYRRLVIVLETELGTAPEPATRALHEAIRDHHPADQDSLPAPARAVRRTNLPAPVDTLIGRDRERAELRQLLATARLVTLTGPGGVGKTRLALAVASDMAAAFPDGAFFVDLSPIRDPALVLSAIARAVEVYDTGSQPQIEALAVTLQEKRLLLLLDNFEQVVDAAPIVANLLGVCPGLKAQVTSRVRLRLRGEQEYPVAPLAVPVNPVSVIAAEVAAAAAGQLFVQRATEARPDFVLTPQNAAAVGEICRRLDGLPLALELAAARVRILRPQMLLERLDAPLAVLTGGARDLPERHQTIRATIAWSHDLLSEAERYLFRRLAVFAGIWTLAAAEAVIGLNGDPGISVLDGLTSLVDKCLLQSVNGGQLRDTETRFAMLETIREFALEQLIASGESAEVQRRHAAFYLGLAEAADAELTSSQQPMWLDRLDADRANLRAALDWALEEDVITGLQLAGALGRFWGMRGSVAEGRAHLDALLALPTLARPMTRARALNAAGLLARLQGDTGRAEALVDEAVHLWRLLNDRRGLIPALYARAWHAKERNDLEMATSRFEECLTLAREEGDRSHVAACLVSLAEIANDQGDAVSADALQREGVALFQELGDVANVGWSTFSLGAMILHRGQPTAALPLLETALAQFHKVEEPRGVAWSLTALAEATWLLAEQHA